jgi:hypothetical protein
MKRFIIIGLIFPLILLSCSGIKSVLFYFPQKVSGSISNIMKPSRVEQAFEGKLSPEEANKAIHAYCQTCHIHRNIPENQCLDTKPALYNRPPYKNASECRVCHFISKEFWSSQFHRVTRFPEEVAQDKYKDFEESYLEAVDGSVKKPSNKKKASSKSPLDG